MRTEICWAELHGPLFLAGTNLGQKLDPKQRGGIKMEYDEQRRHLYVTYNEKTCRIPETSVLSMVEAAKASPVGVIHEVRGAIPQGFNPTAAQVETPMSHVHAGLGAGQTGQEEPKRNKGGRPKGS